MEPVKDTLNFSAMVVKVEEKFYKKWKSGSGPDAVFEEQSLGWYVTLLGSHEALYAGMTKPNINTDDMATVRINFYAPLSFKGNG